MIFKNILLSLQLENYKNIRFLKFIYSHPRFWIFGSKRQTLEYTSKAKIILLLATGLFIFYIVGSYLLLTNILFLMSLIFIILALPLYFIVANIILKPIDMYLKRKIILGAKKKIAGFKNLQIIAITGSYGKTTTKEILGTILSESFEVLMTEGTENTPLGISRLINTQLTKKYKIFIVEMGAYSPGDIKELCDIVGPNISILTGITLQHLERFKNLDNIIDAKFEILECLGADAFAVVDTTTAGVQKGLKTKELSVKNIIKIECGLPYSYKENLSGMIFKLGEYSIDTKLLADYLGNTLSICYEISKYLGQNIQDFQNGVSKIDFIPHRMQLICNCNSNVYIIDDSFNGNLQGIESILNLMKYAPFNGRKILIAGGIVELGDKTQEIHLKIGRQIGEVSDLILLVQGPIGNALKKGLTDSGYSSNKIKIYPSPLSLHEDLKNIIKNGDMIIFQNDLPDNYL